MEGITDLNKNLLNGLLTGALFTSTRGLVPLAVGGVSGVTTVFLLHHSLIWMRDREYISFEMKF